MPEPRLVHVETVEPLTPQLIRIAFGGDGLAGFGAGEFTDHYVKLQLPPAGADYAAPFDVEEIREARPREQWPRTRTYTVAGWDPERRGSRSTSWSTATRAWPGPWAAAARPGTRSSFRARAAPTRPTRRPTGT